MLKIADLIKKKQLKLNLFFFDKKYLSVILSAMLFSKQQKKIYIFSMTFLNIITKIKAALVEIFRLLVAAGILYWLFSIRLVPQIARDLWEHMNYSQLGSIILRIILVLITIYFLFKLIKKKELKKKGRIVQKLTDILLNFSNYIEFLFLNIYQFFWYILEEIFIKIFKRPCYVHYKIVRKLAFSFIKKKNFYKYFCCLMGTIFIPRILFLTAFAYDVFIQQQLNYTFKCLPLLLVPLIENFFIFVLKQFLESFEKFINSFLFTKKSLNSEENLYGFVNGETPDFAENLEDFLENHYSVINRIKEALEIYDWLKYEKFPYYKISFGLAVMRLGCLIYMLIYGII